MWNQVDVAAAHSLQTRETQHGPRTAVAAVVALLVLDEGVAAWLLPTTRTSLHQALPLMLFHHRLHWAGLQSLLK